MVSAFNIRHFLWIEIMYVEKALEKCRSAIRVDNSLRYYHLFLIINLSRSGAGDLV